MRRSRRSRGSKARAPRADARSCCVRCSPAPRREEQDFLVRLIVGELRQGALRGLMLEAIAAAAQVPAAEVRRAAMSAGGLAEVARAALTEGVAGLARFTIRLMQPVLPMLSQSAESTDEALEQLGTRRVRMEARRRARAGPQGRRRGARLYAQPERRHRARARDRRVSFAHHRRRISFSTAKRSRCVPTARRSRSSSRCAASAASSRSRRCGARSRCRCSSSIACCVETRRSSTVPRKSASPRSTPPFRARRSFRAS